MKKPLVAILMGSDSDLDVMRKASDVLEDFKIPYTMQVLSAHRSPDKVAAFVKSAKQRGIKVIIAGAGGAAHLAGVAAAHTTLPVIGVPIDSSALKGLDALLATVQMPSGVPVATVAIGKAGAANAAILAAQVLALSNAQLARRVDQHKATLRQSIDQKNTELAQSLRRQAAT